MINTTDNEKSIMATSMSAAKNLPRAVLRLFVTVFVMLGMVSLFTLSGGGRQSFCAAAVCIGLVMVFVCRFLRFSPQLYLKTFC